MTPRVHRQRVVLLHERRVDAVLAQDRLAEDLGKEAARVAMADRPDLLHLGNCGRNDLHPGPLIARTVEYRNVYRRNYGNSEPTIR